MSLSTSIMTRHEHSPAFGLPPYTSSYSSRKYSTTPRKEYMAPYATADRKTDYRSSYNTNYGTSTHTRSTSLSRKRSPSRSRYDESKYQDLEKRTRALISSPVDSRSRPLPRGPGFRDRNGDPADHKEHLHSLRSNLQRNASLSRDIGTTRRPIRSDHSYLYRNSNSERDLTTKYSRGSLDRDISAGTPRLSRAKRTGSVADLTGRFEDLRLRDAGGRSGSTASEVSQTCVISPRADDVTASPTQGKHSRLTSLSHTDSGANLPDININNKTSRSPSLDSRDRVTVTPKRSEADDDTTTSKRFQYGRGTRQNSNTSLTSCYSTNDRSSPDKVNNMVNSNNNNNSGITGLKNIGNTCFMNSVLQCLSNTKALLEYCLNEDYKSNINMRTSAMKGQLMKVYANVMKSLWRSNDSYITPQEFKSQIAKFAKRFVGYNQQDAQEFLIYLLEGLHEDINLVQEKKKRIIDDNDEVETISAADKAKVCWNRYLDHDNSKVVELFVGQLRSSLTCQECGYVSNTFDPFWDLSLPISKSSSHNLQNCFELFTQEEDLDGDERPTCARCKKRQRCRKRFSIQRFPRVLIIHLKRFNQGSYYRSKLSTLVDFPLENLNLSAFSAQEDSDPILYSLYAVSNHSGSTSGGHYTCYAKNPYSGVWHHFNDQRVSPIDKNRVVSSEAYVLFYELQGPASHL